MNHDLTPAEADAAVTIAAHLAAVPNPTRFTVPPRPEPYDHDDYMENR